jgi:hypothetical protein
VGKPDIKTQPRRHRHRRKNYFEMQFEEIVWDCPGSGLGQETGSCGYGNEPSGSIKQREFFDCLR